MGIPESQAALSLRPFRAAAALGLFLILAAVSVDAVHLGSHALLDQRTAAEEACGAGAAAPHLHETHLHRAPSEDQGVCLACLWHGMGKTVPLSVTVPGGHSDSPLRIVSPVWAVLGGQALPFSARAPPSA